jgi:hypothetical protein
LYSVHCTIWTLCVCWKYKVQPRRKNEHQKKEKDRAKLTNINRSNKLNPTWSTTCIHNQGWELPWPDLKHKLPHLPSLSWLTESPSYYNFSSYQFHLESLFCVIVFSNLSFSSFYKVKLYDWFKCHKFRIIHLLDSINIEWINSIIKFLQLINVIHYPWHPLVATPPITTTRGPFDLIFFVKATNRILNRTIFSCHSSKPTLPYLGGNIKVPCLQEWLVGAMFVTLFWSSSHSY